MPNPTSVGRYSTICEMESLWSDFPEVWRRKASVCRGVEMKIWNPREQMVLYHYRCKQKWSSLDHAIHPETSDHMASLDQAERRLRVKQCLHSLPRHERSAVEATVLEGMSLRAAARRFRVSAMTIQRRLKRGLGRMARTLETDQLSV